MLRRFFDRLRLPFRKDRELRSALYRILGFYPQNIEYYKIAFAHKSQAFRDKNGKPLNNERLEFLGDAVLESVISDILFHHFEKRHEGFLTATRSKIVQRESLNRLAKEMGIDKLIQTATRNTSPHSHLGGNAFEALMGAIYLDKGYKTCQKFVQKQILGRLMDLDGVANKEVNFKSKLLEWCQKNKLKQDFIMRLEENGKQQEPLFHCTVVIESLEFGYGKGHSKKEAQQQAARETLTMLRRDENVVDSVFRSKEKRTAMEANEMAVLPKIDEIEDDLLREQQQAKRPQPAEPRKAERKEQEAKSQAPVTPKEKGEKQPKKEAPKAEQSKEQKPQQKSVSEGGKAQQEKPASETVATEAPTAKKVQPAEKQPTPVPTEAPKKEKKEAKPAPLNVATLAEAAIAEAEKKEAHLPSLVETHGTAVVPTEAPRKREIVPAEDYKVKQQEQKARPKKAEKKPSEADVTNAPAEPAVTTEDKAVETPEVAPASPEKAVATPEPTIEATQATVEVLEPSISLPEVADVAPEVTNVAPEVTDVTPQPTEATEEVPATVAEAPQEKAPKKEKRPRHKVTRIADYTKTEVKTEEEVEAERQRQQEEREEKRRNKRIQREANRAKGELERLSQPKEAPAENDILAEVTLEEVDNGEKNDQQEKSTAALSNSAKRRLRRKRAAERAKQEQEAIAPTPAESQAEQPSEGTAESTVARKKHQKGNSRKRRRQQAVNNNEAQAPNAPAEA